MFMHILIMTFNKLNNVHISIFTFNNHFDKEIDCVYETVITKPHHWR